jgi:hypothetical protein
LGPGFEKFKDRKLFFVFGTLPLGFTVNLTVTLPDPLAGTIAELSTMKVSPLVIVHAQLGSDATTENVVVSPSRGTHKVFGFRAYEHPPAAACVIVTGGREKIVMVPTLSAPVVLGATVYSIVPTPWPGPGPVIAIQEDVVEGVHTPLATVSMDTLPCPPAALNTSLTGLTPRIGNDPGSALFTCTISVFSVL